MRTPKIVFLLFKEGKLVITGGKTIRDLRKAVDIFHDTVLVPYRDYDSTKNYVEAHASGSLAAIVESIIEQFGDDEENKENRISEEQDGTFDDLEEIEENMDRYDSLYKNETR
jgi:hypothetical protein